MKPLKCELNFNINFFFSFLIFKIFRKKLLIDLEDRIITLPKSSVNEKKSVDTTKIKTPFGMIRPIAKKIEQKNFEIENEISPHNSAPIEPIASNSAPNELTTSKSFPIEPTTSKSAKSKKNQTSTQKGNIAAFFGKVEVKKENNKDIKMEIEEPIRKRSVSPEKSKNSENKKKSLKKPKLKEPQNKKRSRIQVMQDSSEEEDEELLHELEERDSKFIKFDREQTPEPLPEPKCFKSPTPQKKSESEIVKHKAKRYVTKRFETDDGFIRTEKVLEEYSGSDDENDENRKKNSSPKVKNEKVSVKKSPRNKYSEADSSKPKDVVKTKQESIMSFFKKK